MMKLTLIVLVAVVASASAGLVAVAPSAYSAEGVTQVHAPWAVSSSSRVQTFNDAIVPVAVPVAAPVHYAAAPIAAHYAAPYAAHYASPYAAAHIGAPLLL